MMSNETIVPDDENTENGIRQKKRMVVDEENRQKHEWFLTLKEWILSNGGTVHPSLTCTSVSSPSSSSPLPSASSSSLPPPPLSSASSKRHKNENNRGVFASDRIAKGETLIELPLHLVISGQHLPNVYYKESHQQEQTQRQRHQFNASSWLRCIASLMSTYLTNSPCSTATKMSSESPSSSSSSSPVLSFLPYINSLPDAYDTLLDIRSTCTAATSTFGSNTENNSSSATQTQTQTAAWSDNDIEHYLSGTTLGTMIMNDRKNNTLYKRYKEYVEPYLTYNSFVKGRSFSHANDKGTDKKGDSHLNCQDNDDMEADFHYHLFERACACISTRGFHLKRNQYESNTVGGQDGTKHDSSENNDLGEYSGPFLLPFIDLLNHSSMLNKKCTTLQRGPRQKGDGDQIVESFFMVAERSIEQNEEILHSYGDDLTSAQLLQTFGFVEDKFVKRAATVDVKEMIAGTVRTRGEEVKNKSYKDSDDQSSFTPAILSKKEIIKACSIVSSSSYPSKLKQIISQMNQRNGEDGFVSDDDDLDEIWDMPTNVQNREKDTINVIPDDILIHYHSFNNDNGGDDEVGQNIYLSDELVTLCCIQFLPHDAYQELVVRGDDEGEVGVGMEVEKSSSICLVSCDVLEDYFLGKLVLKAILIAIQRRLDEYKPISFIFGHTDNEHEHKQQQRAEKEPKASSSSPLSMNVITLNKDRIENDQLLLQQLMSKSKTTISDDNTSSVHHAIYGLTIRVEEKICLFALKRKVLELYDSLDDDINSQSDNYGDEGGRDNSNTASSSKRRKL